MGLLFHCIIIFFTLSRFLWSDHKKGAKSNVIVMMTLVNSKKMILWNNYILHNRLAMCLFSSKN